MADVIATFSTTAEPLGVSEVARRVGVSKAVVHRILRSLESRGLLTFLPDERAYRLGPVAAQMGARALSDSDLREAALPVLRRVSNDTRETTTVSALIRGQRVYLDQVPSTQEIRMTVELGRPFPLHAGSSSRVILAFLPADQREQALAEPLAPLTAQTLDRPALMASLDAIVAHGYAVSRGERQPGAASVAAPLFGLDGRVLGSISACGPVDRFDDEKVAQIAPIVIQAASDISQALGAPAERLQPAGGGA